MTWLYGRPEVLAFLQDAKEHPEDDTPRLALADWLDEQGDSDRAEFIRLQCRLLPGTALSAAEREETWRRVRGLLVRLGGAWLGPLWLYGGTWHRGLLALHVDRRGEPAPGAMLPWADTVWFEVTGRQAFQRATALLAVGAFNHVSLDLRRPLTGDHLLSQLAEVPALPTLRTLTLGWPCRPPAVGDDFFARVAALPLGRRLTHLASSRPLTPAQAARLRAAGIEPGTAQDGHWPHTLAPAAFRRDAR